MSPTSVYTKSFNPQLNRFLKYIVVAIKFAKQVLEHNTEFIVFMELFITSSLTHDKSQTNIHFYSILIQYSLFLLLLVFVNKVMRF